MGVGLDELLDRDIDEKAFKDWYLGHAGRWKLDPNPDDPRHQYDYRAAFKAGVAPDNIGHWPSEFKLGGHPNLIVDGKDTRTGEPAMDWAQLLPASPTPPDYTAPPPSRAPIVMPEPPVEPAPRAAIGMPWEQLLPYQRERPNYQQELKGIKAVATPPIALPPEPVNPPSAVPPPTAPESYSLDELLEPVPGAPAWMMQLPEMTGIRQYAQPPKALTRGVEVGLLGTERALGEAKRQVGQSLVRPPTELERTTRPFKEGTRPATPAELAAPVAEPGPVRRFASEYLIEKGRTQSAAAREAMKKVRMPETGVLTPGASWEQRLEAAEFALGQGLASTVPSIAGAAVGTLVAGPAGGVAGAMMPSYLQNQDEVRQALMDAGIDEARADAISSQAAIPMAALDFAAPVAVVRKMFGPAQRWALGRIARSMVETGGLEGLTEAAQSAIEQVVAQRVAGRPISYAQMAEEGIAGFLTGGVLGVGGAAVSGVRATARPDAVADMQAGGRTVTFELPADQPTGPPAPTGETFTLDELLDEKAAPAAEPTKEAMLQTAWDEYGFSGENPDPKKYQAAVAQVLEKFGDARKRVVDIEEERRAAAPPGGMPGWAREAMVRAGLDPARPLNDVDLGNQSVRDAIEADPTLTRAQKDQIFKTGSPEPPAGAEPPAGPPESAITGEPEGEGFPLDLGQRMDNRLDNLRLAAAGSLVDPSRADEVDEALRGIEEDRPAYDKSYGGSYSHAVKQTIEDTQTALRPLTTEEEAIPGLGEVRDHLLDAANQHEGGDGKAMAHALARAELLARRLGTALPEPLRAQFRVLDALEQHVHVAPKRVLDPKSEKDILLNAFGGYDSAEWVAGRELGMSKDELQRALSESFGIMHGSRGFTVHGGKNPRVEMEVPVPGQEEGEKSVLKGAKLLATARQLLRIPEPGGEAPAAAPGKPPPAGEASGFEAMRAERQRREADQYAAERKEGTELLAREIDRAGEEDIDEDARRLDVEGLYRDRIDAALESGRADVARGLYDEATAIDPETEQHRWLDADEKLEARIAAATSEGKQQFTLEELLADESEVQPVEEEAVQPLRKSRAKPRPEVVEHDELTAEDLEPGSEMMEEIAILAGADPDDYVDGAPAWELTAMQYMKHMAVKNTGQDRVLNARDEDKHEDIVRRAFERGDDIPENVMKHYRHLPWAKKTEKAKAEPEAKTFGELGWGDMFSFPGSPQVRYRAEGLHYRSGGKRLNGPDLDAKVINVEPAPKEAEEQGTTEPRQPVGKVLDEMGTHTQSKVEREFTASAEQKARDAAYREPVKPEEIDRAYRTYAEALRDPNKRQWDAEDVQDHIKEFKERGISRNHPGLKRLQALATEYAARGPVARPPVTPEAARELGEDQTDMDPEAVMGELKGHAEAAMSAEALLESGVNLKGKPLTEQDKTKLQARAAEHREMVEAKIEEYSNIYGMKEAEALRGRLWAEMKRGEPEAKRVEPTMKAITAEVERLGGSVEDNSARNPEFLINAPPGKVWKSADTDQMVVEWVGSQPETRVEALTDMAERVAEGLADAPTEKVAAAPVVQRTLEESGTPASDQDLRRLFEQAEVAIKAGKLPKDPVALRKWAGEVLGRPYESRTWRTDDVYDAIEGAANRWLIDNLPSVTWGKAGANIKGLLESVREVEEKLFGRRTRSAGMTERQQFSTPSDLAYAAAYILNPTPGEKILEPTAGTGNLITPLVGDKDSPTIIANEVDDRRAFILRHLFVDDVDVVSEDALRIPLTGRRVNGIIMNPPFGGRGTGRYSGFGAGEFEDSDISQRFVAQALKALVPGGRLVSIMPQGYFNQTAKPFRDWLEANYHIRAAIESPAGMYETRGTKFGTVLLVVDNQPTPAGSAPLIVRDPTWNEWYKAIENAGPASNLRREPGQGRETAVDVAATEGVEAKKPAKAKRPAEVIDRGAAEPEVTSGEATGAVPEPDAGGRAAVAPGVGGESARGEGPRGGEEPGRREPGPGGGVPAGGEPGAAVVADEQGREKSRLAGETSTVPKLARGRPESHPEDSAERRRELEEASNSPVFAPTSQRVPERRSPHPRVVVETRSMAGMPAPELRAQFSNPLVEAAWGRPGEEGGLSDEQVEGVLQGLTAWNRGHGFLFGDDVGVGKTREAAAMILEAIQRGRRRILYTTNNEANALDAIREFKLVATGKETGEFPAIIVSLQDYGEVLKKDSLESLPMPDGPVIYIAHAYNLAKAVRALKEVHPDVWIADEAHKYKNVNAARGMGWRELHEDMLLRNADFAYLTATPGVTLEEIAYLYGLREWVPGGFSDWVDRKLGYGVKTEEKDEAATAGVKAAAVAGEQQVGDRTGIRSVTSGELEAPGKGKKKRFFSSRPDVFKMTVSPAETEQIMRELKGKGKYLARDLWRGGVTFEIDWVDLIGDSRDAKEARQRYDQAAELARDIFESARKFGYLNKKIKAGGAQGIVRSLVQSYLKQTLFELRLPRILDLAEDALKRGKQPVISVHSVSGDPISVEGISTEDSDIPPNKRLEVAINQINTKLVEKEGEGEQAEYIELGEIPEAIETRARLFDRLRALPPLSDPVRTIEERFGKSTVAAITGRVQPKKRVDLMAEFQSGQRTVGLISPAGKTGISLHDVNGKGRVLIVGDYEWSADTFKQELGRVDRTGQQSPPEIILVASNTAAERKFAATIAARMASLGATSKGSAEATGTDAMDVFDVSGSMSRAAMLNAMEKMPDDLRRYFIGSKFVERKQLRTGGYELVHKRRPDDASMKDFLLEILMNPIETGNAVLDRWVQERELLKSGVEAAMASAMRTARQSGIVTRVTTLSEDPALVLYEVQNDVGEKRGILQGFVTEFIHDIQEARGYDQHGESRTRRYIQFTETESGGLVSGLELNQAEGDRVKRYFGVSGRRRIGVEEAWDDLMSGDKVRVHGPENAEWVLHLRKDDRVQIRGATLAKHKDVLRGYAKYEPVGSVLYFDMDKPELGKFLERFAPVQPIGQAVSTKALLKHIREHGDEMVGRQLEEMRSLANELVEKIASHKKMNFGQKGALYQKSPQQIIEQAIQDGVLDDVTQSKLAQLLGIVQNEGGFLRMPGVEGPPGGKPPVKGTPTAEGEEDAPRILAQAVPRGIRMDENLVTPQTIIFRRLIESKRTTHREIGQAGMAIVQTGKATERRLQRLLHEHRALRDQVRKLGIKPKSEDSKRLAELLNEYAKIDELPEDTPSKLVDAFRIVRPSYRADWRMMGENDRVMLGEKRRAVLDEALFAYPESKYPSEKDPPDFDNLPVNRTELLEALDRAQKDPKRRRHVADFATRPTTRDDWEALHTALRAARVRHRQPIWMDSPDLRRIYDMIQGRGGIQAYFHHVFVGPWRVRAGAQTGYYADRMEAIEYARELLADGWKEGDIHIEYVSHTAESGLFLPRQQYQRLVSAVQKELDADRAEVMRMLREGPNIKAPPRRRWFAHGAKRAVNLETYEQDWFRAHQTYSWRLARKVAFDPFRKAMVTLKDDLPWDGGWRDWADAYAADLEGVPGEFEAGIDHLLQQVTGGRVKPFALQRAASRWQSFWSKWFLMYSPISAVVNLSQLAINGVPAFEKNGYKWIVRGIREAVRKTPENERVLDKAGIHLQYPKYMTAEFGEAADRVNDTVWWKPMGFFNSSERMNRAAMVLAKYHEQRSKGVSEAQAIKAAVEANDRVNFDYSKADVPRIMRNPIGRALFQFYTFPVNEIFYAESVMRWGNARQRAAFLTNLAVLGGLSVLVMGTPLWLLNWLTGPKKVRLPMTGVEFELGFPMFRDKTGAGQTAWEELWDHMPEVSAKPLLAAAKYGILGAFGISASQRLGFGGPREFSSTIPTRFAESLARIKNARTSEERWQAIKRTLPPIAKRLADWADIERTGVMRDSYGSIVKEPDEIRPLDKVAAAVGMQTVESAERFARLERERAARDAHNRRRAAALADAVKAYQVGGAPKARPILDRAKAAGVTITMDQVRQAIKRREQSDIERRIRGTPRDIREELFTPEEEAEAGIGASSGGGRRSGSAPPPPPPPPPPRRVSLEEEAEPTAAQVAMGQVEDEPPPPEPVVEEKKKSKKKRIRVLARDKSDRITDFEVVEVGD